MFSHVVKNSFEHKEIIKQKPQTAENLIEDFELHAE